MRSKRNKEQFNATMPRGEEKGVKRKRFWLRAVFALALAGVSFVSGALVFWFSLDGGMRKLIRVKDTIDDKYYYEIDDDAFYGALFSAVNDELLDDYSSYMTADTYSAAQGELNGSRSGIGLVFSTVDEQGNNRMKIMRVCGNSPSERSGITAGESVIGFGMSENKLTESQSFDELSAFLSARVTGENFFLKLANGEESRVVALAKEEYVENYVFYRSSTRAYGFIGDDALTPTSVGTPLSCLDDDTAYIRLVQFGGVAAEAFDKAMAKFDLEGKKNLVLDLRDNGGGYLDVMQDIAGYFCKGTSGRPTVAIADYGEKRQTFKAKKNVYDKYFSPDSRICVLANEGTASASECLMGCMLDYGATSYADICLTENDGVAKTYGKGIMQTTYYLGLRKDALKLTTAEIKWPYGNSIHGRGILAEDGTKTVAFNDEGDCELQAAIAALFAK